MRIGVTFPQTEIGPDPAVVREYAQTAEALGYSHLLVYDHVLGAATTNRPGWRGYSAADQFHEIFVLFGYLAGLTERIELCSGVLVLPQRQTALVAKQAAQIDRFSNGRLRLGVGIGWNAVEYEALGMNFHNRGRRVEEQIAVLRALCTEEVVTFNGRWHTITEAGINPPSVQRPIPVWIGASAEPAVRRAAALADGWFPQTPNLDEAAIRAKIEQFRGWVREAGRDPAQVGIDGQIRAADGDAALAARARLWREIGATHASLNTMGAGLKPREHIEALRRLKPILDEAAASG